ncbi:hypothetical protein FG386_001348 [Cryptosporidium ryanae]|uniref:uncharacterized protein n=1 Tax=Cryptosporidium ryanae TaxID=515981 RepID=UPI00351A2894|nr:hypothetical protein FG386_001348 [Cryptosporidium ryanae]
MNNLKFYLLFLIPRLIYALKKDDEIMLDAYMGNENDVIELTLLKNDKYLPVNVTTELKLDKYELNDLRDRCCYGNIKESNLVSEFGKNPQLSLNEGSFNKKIQKELFVDSLCKLDKIGIHKNIQENMIRFYDYEYDPSRPINLSPKDMDAWRSKSYNKTKLENLIVPGKGTGRLFVKLNTSGLLGGNYHFSFKITYDDKIETKKVTVALREFPFDLGIKAKEYKAEFSAEESNSFEVTIKNNLIFGGIRYDEIHLVADGRKRLSCSLANKQLVGFSGVLQVGPGEKLEFKIKCGKNKEEAAIIRGSETLELTTGGSVHNYGRNTKYKRSFNLLEETSEIKDTSGAIVFLDSIYNNLNSEYFGADYNFRSVDFKIKGNNSSKKHETSTLILTENDFEREIITKKASILINMDDFFQNMFNLRNVHIFIEIIEGTEHDFFETYFRNQNKELRINNVHNITKHNSIMCLGLVIKINKRDLMEAAFGMEKFTFNVSVRVKAVQDNQEIKSAIESKEYKFQIKFELNDYYIYRGNILKGEANIDKLILFGDDTSLRLNILRISDANADFKSKKTKIELIRKYENGTVFDKKLIETPKIEKHSKFELNVRASNYIGEKEIRNKQLESCVDNSVVDLPYTLVIDEKKIFQIATIDRCVRIDIDSDRVEFGTIPVSILGASQVSKSLEIVIGEGKGSNIWLGFTLAGTYNLDLLFREKENDFKRVDYAHKHGDSNGLTTYIYVIDQKNKSKYNLIVNSNFGESEARIETGKMLNISAVLEVYSNEAIIDVLDGINSVVAGVEVIRDGKNSKKINLDEIGIWERNKRVPKSLFLIKSVAVKCIIRSLDVKISVIKTINPLTNSFFSKETTKMEKLPLSFMLVDLINKEKFPIQYSVQKDESSVQGNTRISEYIKENYAIYIDYGEQVKHKVGATEADREYGELELIDYTVYQDELAFNFPYKGSFLKKVGFDYNDGCLRIFDESDKTMLIIRLISERVRNLYKSVFINFGQNRINSWEIVFMFKDVFEEELILNFRIHETGKMTWSLESNESHLNRGAFRDFTPVFLDNMDSEKGLRVNKLFDKSRLGKSVCISIVPWIEMSNDNSRTGYLLPNEKRVIPILVHNQIVTSSSSKSRFRDLSCSYNLVFKGLLDINQENNGDFIYNYDELFARKLIENDKELRAENTGIRSYFPLSWKVPNILHSSGFGGGFVKKITLVSSPPRLNSNGNKSVGFVVEIQNPIICTGKPSENRRVGLNNSESDDEEDAEKEGELQEENSEMCPPFNNIDLVKGFRIIWYPHNGFSPTNYRSTELLLEHVPKYNFKTNSYEYKSDDEDEEDQGDSLNKIFADYLGENNSGDSDYAYYLKINCNCVLNQQYTFKFSITHHENVQNSVFVPPFGFNVTVQDYSLSWFRLLKSEDRRIKDFSEKICNGKVKILPDNTGILFWERSLLKSIISFSLGYTIDFGDSKTVDGEWELSESSYLDFRYNDKSIKRLISLTSRNEDDLDGILSYFCLNKNSESEPTPNGLRHNCGLEIPEKLPSRLRVRFVARILNNNYEMYQCKSKAYETYEGVPTSPLNLEYFPLTYDSIKVTWETPLSDGGNEIMEYEITLTPSIVINESGSRVDTITKRIKKSFVIIESLVPITTYRCEVRAINKFGSGAVAYIGSITPKETGKNGLDKCSGIGVFGLVIDEDTNKEMSWMVGKEQYSDLDKIYIYTYCLKYREREMLGEANVNGNPERNHRYELVFIHKGRSLCINTREGNLRCTLLEKSNNNGTFGELSCEDYFFAVMENENDAYRCLMKFNSSNMRLLHEQKAGSGTVNGTSLFNRYLSASHISSDEYKRRNSLSSSKSLVYYPRGYNPEWDNGLNKMKVRIGILSPSTTLIRIKVNYLHDRSGVENVNTGNETEVAYLYDLEKGSRNGNFAFKNTWSFVPVDGEEESHSHNHDSSKSPSLDDMFVEIIIINLIPDMTGLVTIEEFDKNKDEISASRHILRIPRRKSGDEELKVRRLLSTNELLSVNLTSVISNVDYFGFSSSKFLSRFRHLNRVKNSDFNSNSNEEFVGLEIRTDSRSSEYLSNSLFISSKVLIDDWPEDYERRLFEEIEITINSGNLVFKNPQYGEISATNSEVRGIVENYKPVSELMYYNNSNDSISALFDGDRNTRLELFKSDRAENYSNFPHIKLSFKDPICVLFVRLNWEMGYSPVSTIARVKVRSSNESRSREREFNPKVHNCDSEKRPDGRTDTIQILPPEEIVNTYFTNPLNRYSSIHEITLHFIGSCRNRGGTEPRDEDSAQGELEPLLSLSEIELVPCITNDLAISYSDPLSQRNNSLVNNEHRIGRSRLRDQCVEIQRRIAENINKEKNKNEILHSKYKNANVSESGIHLELSTILSEENLLRSSQIPKKRILIQNVSRGSAEKAKKAGQGASEPGRRLIQSDCENSTRHLFCNLLDLTVILVLNYAIIVRRRLASANLNSCSAGQN